MKASYNDTNSHDYVASAKPSRNQKEVVNFEEHQKAYFSKEKRHSIANILLVAPRAFWRGAE